MCFEIPYFACDIVGVVVPVVRNVFHVVVVSVFGGVVAGCNVGDVAVAVVVLWVVVAGIVVVVEGGSCVIPYLVVLTTVVLA